MRIYLLASFIRHSKKRCALFATPVESFVRYRLYRLVFSGDAERIRWCALNQIKARGQKLFCTVEFVESPDE
jgi:hypothetical protein